RRGDHARGARVRARGHHHQHLPASQLGSVVGGHPVRPPGGRAYRRPGVLHGGRRCGPLRAVGLCGRAAEDAGLAQSSKLKVQIRRGGGSVRGDRHEPGAVEPPALRRRNCGWWHSMPPPPRPPAGRTLPPEPPPPNCGPPHERTRPSPHCTMPPVSPHPPSSLAPCPPSPPPPRSPAPAPPPRPPP